MDNKIWDIIKNQSDDYEIDWFAIDRIGQIAVFSSFNRGYTPKCVTKSKELYLALEKIIEKLGNTTDIIKVTKFSGRFDDWENYSKKGLFSYDLQDVHRVKELKQYDILFKPQKAVTIKELELSKYFSIIPVFNLEFGIDLSFKLMEEKLI